MTRKQFIGGLSYIGSAYDQYTCTYRCQSLCDKIGIEGKPNYMKGQRYCSRCRVWFELVERCPCCSNLLRIKAKARK